MHCARIIIHEAAHKYLGVRDVKYAWDTPDCAGLPFKQCIDNADSHAWAAFSLAWGGLVLGEDGHDSMRRCHPIEPQAVPPGAR